MTLAIYILGTHNKQTIMCITKTMVLKNITFLGEMANFHTSKRSFLNITQKIKKSMDVK